MIIQHQLCWTGHVVRMPDHRLPKQLLYSQLENGKWNIGGQQKRFKDVLKANFKKFNISTENWEVLAHKHLNWRSAFIKGTTDFEEA